MYELRRYWRRTFCCSRVQFKGKLIQISGFVMLGTLAPPLFLLLPNDVKNLKYGVGNKLGDQSTTPTNNV